MSAFLNPEAQTARRRAAVSGPMTRRKKRRSGLNRVAWLLIEFGLLLGVAFFASSLTGHIFLEKARREGLNAGERARAARSDVALLRQRVERLTSMRAVEQWAAVRGFVTPDRLAVPDSPTGAVTTSVPEAGHAQGR